MRFHFHDTEEEREVGGIDGAPRWLFPKTSIGAAMTDGERQEVPMGMWKC